MLQLFCLMPQLLPHVTAAGSAEPQSIICPHEFALFPQTPLQNPGVAAVSHAWQRLFPPQNWLALHVLPQSTVWPQLFVTIPQRPLQV